MRRSAWRGSGLAALVDNDVDTARETGRRTATGDEGGAVPGADGLDYSHIAVTSSSSREAAGYGAAVSVSMMFKEADAKSTPTKHSPQFWLSRPAVSLTSHPPVWIARRPTG